jgi:hypothetical protein
MEPVACTLGSSELGTQAERWKWLFTQTGFGRTETDARLRVHFMRSAEAELTALVAVERECCKWAEWTIEADEDGLILEITSTGDGISVIHTWLLEQNPFVPIAAG